MKGVSATLRGCTTPLEIHATCQTQHSFHMESMSCSAKSMGDIWFPSTAERRMKSWKMLSVRKSSSFSKIRLKLSGLSGQMGHSTWLGMEWLQLWNDGSEMTFLEWAGNEPTDLTDPMMCIHAWDYFDYKMDDSPCTKLRAGMCKKNTLHQGLFRTLIQPFMHFLFPFRVGSLVWLVARVLWSGKR